MSPKAWLRRLSVVFLCGLLPLAGCEGFFPPINGGDGGSTGSNIVYTANTGSNSVSAYAMSTGALAAVSGSPFSLTFTPTALAVSPNNKFLYVAGLGAVYLYSIGTGGAITAANNGTAVANGNVVSMDISPDGKWMFLLDADATSLLQFAIDPSTGLVSPSGGAAYSFGQGVTAVPKMVKVAPSGGLVFIALGTAGEIVYTLNTSTGALVESQRLAAPATTSDNAVAINAANTYLYIARSGASGGLWVFSIGSGGALTMVGGSPFAGGNQPASVVLDNANKYVYMANRGDGTISAYTIGNGSVLTAVSGSPFSSGTAVNSLAADATGKYIVAGANGGQPDVSMYAFDSATAGRIFAVSSTTSALNPVAIALTH